MKKIKILFVLLFITFSLFGQVTRKASVQALDINVYNVKEYGAIGDGVANDQPAIQNLINSLSNGGTIFFPKGIYKFTTYDTVSNNFLYINHSNIKIIGLGGKNSEILISNDVSLDSVQNVIYADSVDNITYQDLYIYGNGHARNGYGHGIGMYKGTNHVIQNCIVENIQGTGIGFTGSNTEYITNSKIINCSVINSNTDGIALQWTNNSTISNCYLYDIGSAADNFPILLEAATNSKIDKNYVIKCRRGISLNAGSNNVTVSDNRVDSCNTGIYVIDSYYSNIIDNYIIDDLGDGITINASGALYYAEHNISNNTIINSAFVGIGIRLNGVSVSNNIIIDNGGAVGSKGILLEQNASYNFIINNNIYRTSSAHQVTGIFISSGSDSNFVSTNKIIADTLVHDAGTATQMPPFIGRIISPVGSAALPSFSFQNDPNTGLVGGNADGWMSLSSNGLSRQVWGYGYTYLGANYYFGWSSNDNPDVVGPDLTLYRDAPHTFAQKNGTNPQIYNLYRTFTNSSKYSRISFKTTIDSLYQIYNEYAGGHTSRPLQALGFSSFTTDAPTGNTTQQTITLGAGATTFAVTKNVTTVTGDGGANTVATITGAVVGIYVFIFVDALVTITDDDTHAANSVDLAGTATNFTSADDKTLTLVFDGTSWYQLSTSAN